jgi:hypothetical protein
MVLQASRVIIGTDIHFDTMWRDKSGDFGGRCCS